jgi:Flp pilus assembly protein TadB
MGTFTSTSLLAVLLGGIAGAGLLLLVLAIRGFPARPEGAGPGKLETWLREILGWRGAIALILGALTLAATRWVVAGIGIALLALGWRSLGGAVAERRAMNRLEGLAVWTESLRDTIAGAVGLEQAIPASVHAVNESIRPQISLLADRLRTRQPLPRALERLADDLDDPSADLMIAALILNSKLRGPGLRDVLGALSTSTREELDMRRRVEAARKSTRRSAQIVVGVTLVVAGGLTFLNRNFVQPYDSAQGQMVLIFVVAIFALGFLWLRKLADFERPDRFLRTGVDSLLIQEDE